jgi:hypothetical protein
MAQQPQQPAEAAPKASKAEVDRLVTTIKGDPAKLRNYCTIVKLQGEYQQADEQKNEQKLKELDAKMDAAAKTIGPEFDRIMSAELDDASAKSLDDLSSICKA